jgi:hypothetical protein
LGVAVSALLVAIIGCALGMNVGEALRERDGAARMIVSVLGGVAFLTLIATGGIK